MHVRASFAALAIASLSLLPPPAAAAMVQKWQTGNANYFVISDFGDFNGDGVYKLITGELTGNGAKIGVRSGTTGALLAQTALVYQAADVQFADLDADGTVEIIFSDLLTGKLNCLEYTTGSSTLAVRWSIVPQGQAATLFFADFDGNGKVYLVLSDATQNPSYHVYDRNGVLFGTITPNGPTGNGWSSTHRLQDYDNDGRAELLIDYHNSTSLGDQLFVYENNAPVDVLQGVEGRPGSIALGSSFPNPTTTRSRIEYAVPTSGPATLRLFDVSGREVRTLVDGKVPAGTHEAIWDGRDANGRALPAGAYFYELNAGGERLARRVVRIQ